MSAFRRKMIKSVIHKSLRALGLDIIRFSGQGKQRSDPQYPPDFRDDEIDIIQNVSPWTMTSPERVYALIQATRYVSANAIPGAIVECGVWKGGSMAAIAATLLQLQDVARELYLFDTFTGMSKPSARDFDYSGRQAADLLSQDPAYWCSDAPLEDVKNVLYGTGYPKERIHFVQGKVEQTLPGCAPNSISLLRLDTDWYESTSHELVHLFPRLSRRGVLIIDDYGHWGGCRQACDEYFARNRVPVLLNRIDYTARIALKP